VDLEAFNGRSEDSGARCWVLLVLFCFS